MKIIQTISEMQQYAEALRRQGKIIGFVPTMGFLHEGHLSLVRLARPRCDIVVVSIFVNPTQFAPNEDLDKYPRDFRRDEQLCEREQVDVIFYPTAAEMYPQPYRTFVSVEKLTETMCGTSRPGHFRGVATVVAKLFNIVKPHLAVFGEKDYQQAQVIRQMVRDLNFDVEILTGPIVREPDGLAMSSRNKYLTASQRKDALLLHKSLQLARKLILAGERNSAALRERMEELIGSAPTSRVDYIAVVDPETLEDVSTIRERTLIALAVYIGQTRLIDNMVVELSPPHN